MTRNQAAGLLAAHARIAVEAAGADSHIATAMRMGADALVLVTKLEALLREANPDKGSL